MICFVIALDGEAAPVLANMQDIAREDIYGKKVYSGKLCGDEVRVLVCGVGKVNAACAAMLAIDRFKADAIINIGTAGALNHLMEIGGIYPVSHAAQYDFDLKQINGTDIGVLNEFSERWLPLACTGEGGKKVATGDRFNDDRADFFMLRDDFCADLRDIECGAAAQVCAHAKVPLYAFKVVSDVAGSGSTTEQYCDNIALCYKNIERDICGIYAAVLQNLKG